MLVLWFIRFFVFHLFESPKYLMGRGRDEEAVEMIHKVAEFNGKTSSLTLEDLTRHNVEETKQGQAVQDTSAKAAVLRQTEKFKADHIRSLFRTPKLAWSTGLIILIWGTPETPVFSGILADSNNSGHRAGLPVIQCVRSLLPCNSWCRLWRRFGLHHLPQSGNPERYRCARSYRGRGTGRGAKFRPQRCTINLNQYVIASPKFIPAGFDAPFSLLQF